MTEQEINEKENKNDSRSYSTGRLLARIGVRLFIFVCVILFAVLFFSTGLKYLTPFILAYFISTLLLIPLIKRLPDKLRKVWAIIFAILILLIVIASFSALVYVAVKEGYGLVKNRDQYFEGIKTALVDGAEFINRHSKLNIKNVSENADKVVERINNWINTELPKRAPSYAGKAGSYLPSVGSFLISFLFFIMGTYYICADHDNINSFLRKLLPVYFKPHIHSIKKSAGSAAFGYLKAQIIISSIIGLIAFVVFLVIGQDYALLFAILIAIFDFIPLLGSAVVLVPWVVLLILRRIYLKALVYSLLCFGLFMFRRIVEPRIVGGQTGLHPLLSLICLYVGIKLGGLFGMIVAPIICMMLIGLINLGFFTPALNDLGELFRRILKYSGMLEEK